MKRYVTIWGIGLAIVAIAINTREMFTSFGRAFQQVAFQVGSIIMTTDMLPQISMCGRYFKTILVILYVCGACAGSARRRYQGILVFDPVNLHARNCS